MSLLNGLGTGLKTFGADLAKDEEDKTARMSLLNNAPPPVAPAVAAPVTPAPLMAADDSGEPSKGMGNKLDAKVVERAHQVYTGLVERGLDSTTAVGFAANAVQESGANPGVHAGDSGASHGLLQWNGTRLANYIAKFGHPPEQGTLDESLDFITHELKGPEAGAYQKILAAAPDPVARAGAISQFYERPRDTAVEIARRGDIARQLVGHFANLVTGGV